MPETLPAVPDEAAVDRPDEAVIAEPAPRVYDLRVISRGAAALASHPHARTAGRHAGYVAAGIVVASRRRRKRRTLTSEMAHLAAARGDMDKAKDWAELDHKHQIERAERRRKAWETAGHIGRDLPHIAKGAGIVLAAAAVLLLVTGNAGAIAGIVRTAAAVTVFCAHALELGWRDGPWLLGGAALALLARYWHIGRTASEFAPAWSIAAKPEDGDRGLVVTADGIVVALKNLSVPKLDKAFKDGWQPAFQLTPIRDGDGYSAIFSLPMGVTAAMIADKNEVFARNLHRAACEVWVTDAERAKLAPAGFVSLYVLNPGVLDRPAPDWPLLHEGQADVFNGVPGGIVARGDATRIPVIANNLVLGGQMGMGKSNAGRVFILGCATDPLCELHVFVFAGNGDFDSFEPRLATYVKGTDDAEAAAAVQHLHALLDEVGRREGRLAELGAKKLTRRIAEQHPDMRPSVSLFSECHELFGHPEYGELAAELAVKVIKRARKTGIVLAFDTQSSRAAAIPGALVELVSVNVCFYVKTWRSNDGFLGDGSFQGGIRATELRPARDVGRAVVTGISDAQFDLLKWYLIFNDDDTGEDDAKPVIERCMRELAPGTKVSGGDGAPLPAITVRDLLGDLAMLMMTRPRAKLADLAVLLRDMDSAYLPYRRLDGVRLAALLDAEGVRWVNPRNVPQLDAAELAKVLAAREVS